MSAGNFIFTNLRACDFARTQATRTNRNGCGCTINNSLYLADIRLPTSVGLAVRVGDVLSENNALSTDTTFCHFDTSQDGTFLVLDIANENNH